MGINCGSTGAIPDCLGAQDSVWEVSYIIPRPPKILYKYPNQTYDFAEIEGGVEYEIVERNRPDFDGGNCPNSYKFYVRWRRNPRSEWINQTITPPGSALSDFVGPVTRMLLYLNSNINITYDREGFPSVQGEARGGSFLLTVWMRRRSTNKEAIFTQRFGNTGIYEVGRAEYLGMQSLGIPEEDCEPEWTFRVFDCDERKIFERTERERPEVQKIPCKLFPEDEQTIKVSPGNIGLIPLLLPKGLQVTPTITVPDGKKAVLVQVVTALGGSSIPGSAMTILRLTSPKCCTIHPKVCWDCEGCKEKCPPNTCLKILDPVTNKICCYGKNGKIIATANPDCETADC